MYRLGPWVFLVLLSAPVAFAAGTPERIHYQGVLRDAQGDPEDGDFDIRFRFFDAAAAGNELLVDEHLAGGAGAVAVSGGLFGVALGSGELLDGAGPGVYSSLVEVFADQSAVWLELEIAGETLAPRVAIEAVAFALNAETLRGRGPEEFIDTSADPQEKTGLFTASGGVDFGAGTDDDLTAADVDALTGGGNADGLHTHALVGSASDSDLLDALDSTQFLRSDADDTFDGGTLTTAAGTVLSVEGALRLEGPFHMNFAGPEADQLIGFYDSGVPGDEWFGWSESLDRFVLSNNLRLENGSDFEVTGDEILLNAAGPDTTQAIYFYNGGEPTGESMVWDDVADRFWFSDAATFTGPLETEATLTVGGSQLVIGEDGPDQTQTIAFYDDGSPLGEFIVWDDDDDEFRLTNDLSVSGDIELAGDTLSLGGVGVEATQRIRFFEDGSPNGESLAWDDADDRFELTDQLAITGPLRVGSTTATGVSYNTIGSGTPDSSDITSGSDLFVTADLEVGSQLYMNSDEYLQWSTTSDVFFFSEGLRVGDAVGENIEVGGRRLYLDVEGSGVTEFLEFLNGEFNLTDDLDILGSLTANSKNFVQNHPLDPGLEIVYTTLEGPEAATFTRGSARLADGEAVVGLDETFAWVTNPELGLTATLTPRGEWADLFVVSVTPEKLVVRGAPGAPPDAVFDYLVLGPRIGYEEAPTVRPRKRDASLPSPETHRSQIAGRPDLVRYTPLARYRETERSVFDGEPADLAATQALRRAIGTSADVATRSLAPGEAPRTAGPPVGPPDEPEDGENPVRGDREPSLHADPVLEPGGGVGRSYEDPQGNFYARSFRPGSGGLDSVSPAVGEVEAGDVLSLERSGVGVRRVDRAEDVTVVGIATGAPVGGEVPFAVAGIVLCKVDADFGPILPGDVLVSSPTPGHAMRLDHPNPGTIVGKALQPFQTGTGTIRVLVTLR